MPSGKPEISIRRPVRPPREGMHQPRPTPITAAPVPNIDADSPEAIAFAMRGRPAGPESRDDELARTQLSVEAETALPAELKPQEPEAGSAYAQSVTVSQPPRSINEEDWGAVAVKLPLEAGRKLAAIADRRGSKRTHVAIEALTEPLRKLASEHRAGGYPELPKIISGSVRSSIAFTLPKDLAEDLNYVLRVRRAVKAQVITRLLVPAIEEIYNADFHVG